MTNEQALDRLWKPKVSLDQHIAWLIEEHDMSYVAHAEVEGESFAVMRTSEGEIEYIHPQWSVTGSGATMLEAEQNLQDEAWKLYEAMKDTTLGELTEETWSMLYWCARCRIRVEEERA